MNITEYNQDLVSISGKTMLIGTPLSKGAIYCSSNSGILSLGTAQIFVAIEEGYLFSLYVSSLLHTGGQKYFF